MYANLHYIVAHTFEVGSHHPADLALIDTANARKLHYSQLSDRLFPGVQFSEVDGDILFCFAMNEELAAEMEDKYALHISIVASDILRTEIGIVMVLPRVLQ